MTAELTLDPANPATGATAIATATGGGSYKNRLLVDDVEVVTVCTDDAFEQGIDAGAAGSHTLKWQQLIAGTWTLLDSLTFTTAAAATSSGVIVVTTNNRTIEDLSFTAPTSNGPNGTRTIFISCVGTAAVPIDGLTIRRCTFSGGTIAIWLRQVTNFTIEDCVVEDADYAGIDVWSAIHGVIQRNTVRRIGYSRTDFTDTAFLNNAYGIIMNRNESASLVTDPRSEDILVDRNVIDYVPIWMGINTHGGKNLEITNNRVSHCPRGIFCAGSPTGAGTTECIDITVDSNYIDACVTKSGGSTDKTGITAIGWTGTSIQNNQTSTTYSNERNQSGTTGVTVAGNTTF